MKIKVIYIMGVSGCGKTTVGKLVSDLTAIPFFDGDDFHPPSNISKMESGLALNDTDRESWLNELNALANKQIREKESAIIGSSALKEKYRDTLQSGIEDYVQWVYLKGDFETIAARINHRDSHFMPPTLLQSQFDALEEPNYGLHFDITMKPTEIAKQLITTLEL